MTASLPITVKEEGVSQMKTRNSLRQSSQPPTEASQNSRAIGGKSSASNLGQISRRFVEILSSSPEPLDIAAIANSLDIKQRRIYDITNVLEGCGFIKKEGKKRLKWCGPGASAIDPSTSELASELKAIEMDIARAKNDLRMFSESLPSEVSLCVSQQDVISSATALSNRTKPNFEAAPLLIAATPVNGSADSMLAANDSDDEVDRSDLAILGIRAAPGSEMILSTLNDNGDRYAIDLKSDEPIHCIVLSESQPSDRPDAGAENRLDALTELTGDLPISGRVGVEDIAQTFASQAPPRQLNIPDMSLNESLAMSDMTMVGGVGMGSFLGGDDVTEFDSFLLESMR
ncbi:transcription factor E2F-like [Carpediemonas membranifera]|uniref:Transcription factor E2F-like n=1 Tax=Carpediemonas membranifera TaxID=201153 RepID=A0A8J6BCH3_9EUKA|nr:transcription factor E2F-like [Carpediemonas membranifera]|eukprot:KAG9397337.1 transcription factor E2F-like [Carpediemonas membranifera]